MPNLGVSEEAVSLLKSALGTGLSPGVADADKAYFANALVDRLHEPAVNLGFTPSTDYRVDRLGVQGQKGGAELIEGKYHCPAMPIALKNATIDLVTKKIDEETFQTRRKTRIEFELRPKEKADEKGRTPMMCPAAGDSPTVTCPIREMSRKAVDKERTGVEVEDLPTFADKICTQHSVSFTKEDGMRQSQAFAYRSKEWEEFHRHARNSIESLNGGVKDLGHEAIEEASRRRVRGFAVAQVFVTILLTNYNLRKIATFAREQLRASLKPTTSTPVEKKVRRRDGEFHNDYTDTYPPGARPVFGPQKFFEMRT
jgi:hypothetical protein